MFDKSWTQLLTELPARAPNSAKTSGDNSLLYNTCVDGIAGFRSNWSLHFSSLPMLRPVWEHINFRSSRTFIPLPPGCFRKHHPWLGLAVDSFGLHTRLHKNDKVWILHVYAYVHIHTYIHTSSVGVCVYIYIYVCVQLYVWMYVCMHICMYVHSR